MKPSSQPPSFQRKPAFSLVLGLAGVAAAVVLAALFWSDHPIGPEGIPSQLLGSFFALLGGCGALALVRRWGPPARDLAGRLSARTPLGRLPATASRRLASAIALAAATGLLSLWFHDLAFSHDHAEHCFKAYHFWHEMLGRGRLEGWSHFLAFGYPSGELTPFGPELWVALFRAVTLGLLSWTQTYALAFSGVVVFAVSTVYRFARRFFGSGAGIIAAAIWALDPGGWYQGGWFWFEWLGVWPVTLSLSFTLLAILRLADLLAEVNASARRDVLWAAFWIAASLVTHQLPIVVYAVALPCLLLAGALARGRLARRGLLRFSAAVALGVGLASFYLIPMFARNGLTQDLGVRGFALDDLAHRLVEMRLFEGGWSPIVVLGLFGAVVAIRRRAIAGIFFVLCASAFVLLSSDLLVGVFNAYRLFPGILKIECQRMLLVAKLFWFPLAAYAAAGFFRARASSDGAPDGEAPAPAPAAPRAPWQRAGAWLLIAGLGAPLLRPAVSHIFNTQVDKTIEHRAASPLGDDLRAFWSWSRNERARTNEPYKIGYAMRDRHDHMVGISPIFNQTQVYKVGYTSAQQFRSFPMSGETPLLDALSVKYLVTEQDPPGPGMTLERTFGQLRVYRLAGYHGHHPYTLDGGGQVELVAFEPERIHLRLHGTSPGAHLRLHVADYPRWEARLNGQVVPITPATVHDMEYPILMEVPAADGDLVFRYVRRAPDWIGFCATLVALGIFGMLALDGGARVRRQRWFVVAAAAGRRAAPIAAWAGAGIVLLAVGLAVWRMASPTRLDRDDLYATAAPARAGRGAGLPAGELTLAGSHCQPHGAARWTCGPYQVEVGVVGGAYGSHLCLTAPAVGPLVLSARTSIGRFVEITYDPSGSAPGRVRLSVDGKIVGDGPTRLDDQGLQFLRADTRARAGTIGQLRLEIDGPPLHCFDARIVR